MLTRITAKDINGSRMRAISFRSYSPDWEYNTKVSPHMRQIVKRVLSGEPVLFYTLFEDMEDSFILR